MTYTVSCFLCRASYRSRDQLEDHLTYQHGVVFNVDFVTRISQYRTLNDKLPTITLPKTYNNNSRKECSKCVKSSNATNKKKPPPGPQLDKIKSEANESSDKNEKEQENVDLKKVTLEESVTPQKSGENSFSSIKVKPQNIRDKTNTYCNVCDLKLDSRILFLSHCSTVHDVKFKGKAGKPLIIPQDQEPNVDNKQPTSSTKSTKSSPTSTSSGSPPKKKAKLSHNSSDMSTPRRTPVPCQFCGKVFSNLSNKERHERQSCRVADKNKIEEKEFKCTIGDCSRNFSKIGYLKKHMSTDHENV